jgi:predicted peptidase
VAGTIFVQNLRADNGYIGIAPICTSCGEGTNDDWASDRSMTALKGLVDNMVADYQIDKNRIYIWGFSRGSIGTWEMVKRYGSFFKAAVPVSTCGRKTTFTAADGAKFKSTKTYAVVGSGEDTSCMQGRVNYINNAGGSAKIKILSGVNHEKMTNSFPYTEIIDNWLLKQ